MKKAALREQEENERKRRQKEKYDLQQQQLQQQSSFTKCWYLLKHLLILVFAFVAAFIYMQQMKKKSV